MEAQGIADRAASIIAAKMAFLDHSGLHEQAHVSAADTEVLEEAVLALADHMAREGKKVVSFRPRQIKNFPEWRGKSGDVEVRLVSGIFGAATQWRVDVCYA